jgi:hypothetical protein
LRDGKLSFSIPCYAFDIQNAASDKISEIDILTIQVVPSNIAGHFRQLHTVFDENLDDNLIIWDWTIRKTTARADGLMVNAIIPGSIASVRQSKAFAPDMYEVSLKSISHSSRITFSVSLVAFQSIRLWEKAEVKALNEKINTIGSLLAHSKDEIEVYKRAKQRAAT